MRSGTIFIIILSVAAFAGCELLLNENDSTIKDMHATNSLPNHFDTKEKRDDTDTQISQLNKEVEHLRNKVDKLAETFEILQASNHLMDDNSVDLMEEQNIEDGEDFVKHDVINTLQEELEERFTAETIDSQWGNHMESRFQSSLNQLPNFGLKDTQMIYQECKATLCNAEFVHGKGEDLKFLAAALTMPEIEKIDVLSTTTEDGSLISKVFFYREGF